MIDVTHHRDDRRTAFEVFLVVLNLLDGIRHFFRHIAGGIAKLFSHDIDGFRIQTLIDAHHHTD